jgi:hypothetical protein
MKKKINPVIGLIIAVVVLAGVGFLTSKFFGGPTGGSGKTIIIKPDNPSDPKYRGDPAIAGGGG